MRVRTVGGARLVTQSGSILIEADGENGKELMHLHGVLYLPGLTVNLFSMQKLAVKNVFPFYKEVEGKVVLRKQQNGEKREQVALMIIDENGRSTLDCKVMKREYENADAMQISWSWEHGMHFGGGQVYFCRFAPCS